MKIRLIIVIDLVETVKDYPTTELNYQLTLSHIGQAMEKAKRAFVIHENGWECDVLKEVA